MWTALVATLALAAAAEKWKDRDTDRDGLPDFQEVHKYFTDPEDADSDGDGTPDGDPDERREYAYTVRTVLDVLLPFDEASIVQDDYQDADVLERTPTTVRLEVIHYPFNTNAMAIEPDPRWRDARLRREWLAPGPTSNWDGGMRKRLLRELEADGIDLDALDDAAAARSVAKWLMDRATTEDSFTTFAVEFERGRPVVHPRLRDRVREALARTGRTEEEQWDHELLGKGMFENRVHGSCTSCAIYLQTALRAAGLPTRTVVCVPAVDASDEGEVAMLDGLEHHGMRRLMKRAARERGRSWASHTFNEVWVGGRWRRLNYAHLGQNSLFAGMMGLMTHVHTFRDHAEAGLVTWGLRDADKPEDDLFGGTNPYSCVEIDDRFGAHCEVPNPEVGREHRTLTVKRLYWFDDPTKHPTVDMRLDDPETAGHLVMHVAEAVLGEGPSQYARFFEQVDKEFVLRARGRGDDALRAHATRGYWVDVADGLHDFYLRVDPDVFQRMRAGVEYELAAVDRESAVRWIVPEGVTIVGR